jgi:hypothetical protein
MKCAATNYSVALGWFAVASKNHTFVFSDGTMNDDAFHSPVDHSASFLASNGFYLNSSTGYLWNGTSVLTLAEITVTAATNTIAANVGPCYSVSNLSHYTRGTVTVTRASGAAWMVSLTNSAVLTFDLSTIPTNTTYESFGSIYVGPHSLTFDSSVISTNAAQHAIPGSSGITLATNDFNGLVFVLPAYVTNRIMRCGQ